MSARLLCFIMVCAGEISFKNAEAPFFTTLQEQKKKKNQNTFEVISRACSELEAKLPAFSQLALILGRSFVFSWLLRTNSCNGFVTLKLSSGQFGRGSLFPSEAQNVTLNIQVWSRNPQGQLELCSGRTRRVSFAFKYSNCLLHREVYWSSAHTMKIVSNLAMFISHE